jgi:hypothetical protein
MPHVESAWEAHQRRRWTRSNARLFIQPDADRYQRPEYRSRHQLLDDGRKYDPNQPRVPAGNPDGGQWTALGLGEESEAEYRDSATEFSSTGKSKGHHVVPRAVYKNISLPPETRKIFDEATTGPIRLRASSEGGLLRGHYWDGPNGAHGQYSQAVHNLLAEYMVEHKIGAERMTPDQAGTFVEKVKQSQDPRIRNYLNSIKLLQGFFRFRSGGRGLE